MSRLCLGLKFSEGPLDLIYHNVLIFKGKETE